EPYQNGFQGAFIDDETVPEWSRKIAQHERAAFRHLVDPNHWTVEQVMPSAFHGAGAGKRVVSYAYIMKALPGAFKGSQDHGNCVAWGCREISDTLLGLAIATGDVKRAEVRHGTALVYGSRGSSSQGMDLATAAKVLTQVGQSEEKDYGGGIDLSTESKDENAGNSWGRSGPPAALVAAVKGDSVKQMYYIESITPDVIRDIFVAEGVLNTGSTLTARGPCDPVAAGMTRIGGHDQAILGYDDTQEAKDRYKTASGYTVKANDFFLFMDQSWGPDWISLSGWMEDLWGPRPEGMVVLLYSQFQQLVGGNYGECQAVVGINGFQLGRLPDYGGWAL
ncbi:MAG: hypothetical protein PHU85_07200, partial [Phycisphaerae bacterium]|nr:hypothetical protein [Phycisphaerae bacterium]